MNCDCRYPATGISRSFLGSETFSAECAKQFCDNQIRILITLRTRGTVSLLRKRFATTQSNISRTIKNSLQFASYPQNNPSLATTISTTHNKEHILSITLEELLEPATSASSTLATTTIGEITSSRSQHHSEKP